MKILVTGGAGFIGFNLIHYLLKKGHEVVSLDNYETGLIENHLIGVKYIKLDIQDIKKMDEGGFDICFHLAALSRIQPSFENPKETFRVNSSGCIEIAEWAKENKVKIIYAGSSSRWHNPYISPYACFKYIGEEIFKLYKLTFKTDIEICRFYNVYGPREILDGDWAAVIGIWRRQVRDKQKITIVGDGNQRRDFTHVDDIVDGLYKIAISNHTHNDAWELGTGVNYSINEVFEMFKLKFPEIQALYLEDQNGNYRETLRENNDAITKLNWDPKDRLKEYIKSL